MDEVARKTQERLDELQAAALCFAATDCPDYNDSRADLLKLRAEKRLLAAAREYHSYVMAISLVAVRSK